MLTSYCIGGTHFVKSASFGGKFTLLRQSEISIEETREEWSAKMQTSANSLFESRSSSAGAGVYWSAYGYCSNMTTFSSFFRSADDTDTTEQPILIDHGFTVDDIIVEGGHQRVASILSDRNRAGFKMEFQDWLDSISNFPKGYDFKFGEILELFDMNFRDLVVDGFDPCWDIDGREPAVDKNGNEITSYTITIKIRKEMKWRSEGNAISIAWKILLTK